ncbi:MAG: hypothetical protein ACUVQD_03035 [Thermaceae bacterium]
MELVFALLATLLSWALAIYVFARYRVRPSLHGGFYTLGLFFFALGVSLELLARFSGEWAPWGYRLWYFVGAMHGVTFLGLGSLALLNPKAARVLILVLSPFILYAAYLVFSAPLDLGALPLPYAPSGKAFPPPALVSPRLWTIPFNLIGTLLMLGVALYSGLFFWRKNPLRAKGTLLIALAALVLASTSTLNRFGVVGLEELGRMVGVGLLTLGVALADRGAYAARGA